MLAEPRPALQAAFVRAGLASKRTATARDSAEGVVFLRSWAETDERSASVRTTSLPVTCPFEELERCGPVIERERVERVVQGSEGRVGDRDQH